MSRRPAATGSRPSRSREKTPPLSDLDLRILSLLQRHRVLTQNQLAAINPETPERTLRYRCARLAREGLAGRSRPYRKRGSAPHHLWPTRKGEAIASGAPPPRGGERREPNPLFLAHAAGLSEVYVALVRGLPVGAELARFEREGAAREPFRALVAREERAIAPDAYFEVAEGKKTLAAFLELDMGSMSHRRLKQKAAGYADYVAGSEERTARAEQERLGAAYLSWRQREARRRFKAQGLLARLGSAPGDFLAEVDARSLRQCERCEEIAYPDPDRARKERKPRDVSGRCHFCGQAAMLIPTGCREVGKG